LRAHEDDPGTGGLDPIVEGVSHLTISTVRLGQESLSPLSNLFLPVIAVGL